MLPNRFVKLYLVVQQTPTYLTIIAGLLLVSYQYWAGPLPFTAQLVFCAGLLLVAGIPHGALDHLIEQEHSTRKNQPFSMPAFLVKYLLMIAVYGTGWLMFPVVSLVLFLLISAWHFGETDLENTPDNTYWLLTRLVEGGLVLAFILLTHAAETTPILARIVQYDAHTMEFWHRAASQSGELLRGWATLLIVLVMLAFGQYPMHINGWRLGRLGVILLLTYCLPLLPAFMLYFGGWHALSSFGTIRSYLQQSTGTRGSIWKLWRKSMPLTIIAFGFLLVCTGVWYSYATYLDPIPCLFILLSLITLPHIQVMHQLSIYSKRL